MADDTQKFNSFQFPLCLLAFGADWPSRARAILNWCVMTQGSRRFDQLGTKAARERAARFPKEFWPWGSREGKRELPIDDITKIVLGLEIHGLSGGSAAVIRSDCREAESFRRSFAEAHGNTPSVRIGKELLLEVIQGGGVSHRDFAVLCALNAAIGNKAYCQVTRDRIRASALGYQRPKMLFNGSGELLVTGQDLLSQRRDRTVAPLTPDQVRYTLRLLQERGLISAFHCSPRKTVYSSTLKPEQLAEAVVARAEENADQTARMAALKTRMATARNRGQDARAIIVGKGSGRSGKGVGAFPAKSPQTPIPSASSPHTVPIPVPTTVPTVMRPLMRLPYSALNEAYNMGESVREENSHGETDQPLPQDDEP